MTRLPSKWIETTIGEIAEVRGGIQKQPKRRPVENKFPFLRVANVGRGWLDLDDVHEVELFEDEIERYRLCEGDLLVVEGNGSPAQIGRSAMWRGEIPNCVHQNHLIRVRPSSGVNAEFLTYLWNAPATAQLLRSLASSTSGLYTLSTGKVGSVPVVLPPIEEQQRIVAAIDERFSRLDAADASLVSAQRRLKVLREQVLEGAGLGDWPTKPLVELTPPDRPICYGILMPKDNLADGVPFVRVKDFPAGKVLVDQLHRTSPEIDAKYARSRLRPNDVLISIRGTFGRIALVPAELDQANITQDTARVTCSEEVRPEYLACYLQGVAARRYFRAVARGVAVKGVNIGDLRQLPIPLPPLAIQQSIVERIDEELVLVDQLQLAVDHAQKRSAQLRRSILQQAFSGELVPQDSDDEPAKVSLDEIGPTATAGAGRGRGTPTKEMAG